MPTDESFADRGTGREHRRQQSVARKPHGTAGSEEPSGRRKLPRASLPNGGYNAAAARPTGTRHVHTLPSRVRLRRRDHCGTRVTGRDFNNVNTTAGHGHPAEEVPLREETISIHDIEVTLKSYNVKRVHLEPHGRDLELVRVGDAEKVTVPKLEVHAMVVVELG